MNDEPIDYMPWGQYKSKLLAEIDDDGYLRWVRDEADFASPELKAACDAEIETREGRKRASGCHHDYQST
jgi:hypothetical protein